MIKAPAISLQASSDQTEMLVRYKLLFSYDKSLFWEFGQDIAQVLAYNNKMTWDIGF